jgi:hypothetical protein
LNTVLHDMTNRAPLTLIVACCAGALAFVGIQVFRSAATRVYTPDTAFTERARLTEFSSNGVRVVIFAESDPKGQPLLRATFAPIERGFHVYSKDLDTRATGGVGTPTQFGLLPHHSIKTAGPLFADAAPEKHQGIDIYPDGPVSLRLPVQFVAGATNIAAQVAISYMACKTDGVCLRPVEREILDVRLTAR